MNKGIPWKKALRIMTVQSVNVSVAQCISNDFHPDLTSFWSVNLEHRNKITSLNLAIGIRSLKACVNFDKSVIQQLQTCSCPFVRYFRTLFWDDVEN